MITFSIVQHVEVSRLLTVLAAFWLDSTHTTQNARVVLSLLIGAFYYRFCVLSCISVKCHSTALAITSNTCNIIWYEWILCREQGVDVSRHLSEGHPWSLTYRVICTVSKLFNWTFRRKLLSIYFFYGFLLHIYMLTHNPHCANKAFQTNQLIIIYLNVT